MAPLPGIHADPPGVLWDHAYLVEESLQCMGLPGGYHVDSLEVNSPTWLARLLVQTKHLLHPVTEVLNDTFLRTPSLTYLSNLMENHWLHISVNV